MRGVGSVRRWSRIAVALLFSLALLDPLALWQTHVAAATASVSIQNFAFIGPNGSDGNVTIPVNTTVVWTNRDPFAHTVMHDAPTPLFDSGNLATNDTYAFTFAQPGRFPYHCMLHPTLAAMRGTITVVPLVAGVSAPTGPVLGGTAVTITGAGFQNGATVAFGGVPATNIVIVNDTTITATTPAHMAGAVDVVVTDPGDLAGTLAGGFTYLLPSVLPPPKQPGGVPGTPIAAPPARPTDPTAPGNPPAPLPPRR